MRDHLAQKLSILLADTFALTLKTQNYHWHVQGPAFYALHQLFEAQYRELGESVDAVAEQIRMLGRVVPATLTEYQHLKTIQDGHSEASANDMLLDLVHDHGVLLQDLQQVLEAAEKAHHESVINLVAERISAHEKARWMLSMSCEKV